jgi:DUF4097 and DUF4098 domain-containing protein YvlB
VHKAFDIDGPARIEVRQASGEIVVDPTLEGRIEVELTAHDDESQRLVDNARIELNDRHLVIDVPNKRGGFNFSIGFGRQGITCRIRCPRSSALSVRSKSANVVVRGTIGGLNVSTASGDVEADRIEGALNIKSASGDTRVHEVLGGASVQTASGDIDLEIVRGAANVTSVSGDVTIGEAYGNVSSNTVSGDQNHGAVMTGKFAAHSVSGDVAIGVRRGSKVYLDCNTVSGDTSSELDLTTDPPAGDGPLVEIKAKTVSGDIRITRAAAPASTDAQEVHA